MILLTDEENPYRREKGEYDYCEQPYEADAFDKGAKAQFKKVVEWFYGECEEHDQDYRDIEVLRYECSECKQALLKENE